MGYKCWTGEKMSVTAASFFLSRVLMIWKDARLYQGSYILILAKFGPPPAGLQCYGDALFQLCLGVSFGGTPGDYLHTMNGWWWSAVWYRVGALLHCVLH